MASEIRVNSLTNRSGLSTVTIADTGVVVAGIVTASTFSGPLTGDVTGNVTGNTSGTATNLTGSPSITVTDITATGNLSIGGVLTYDDVTNVDSVGIVTARTGIDVTGGHIDLVDNSRIRVGTGDDLQIYHDGSHSYINQSTAGNLYITHGSETMIGAFVDGKVELRYDNSKKLETTTTGVTVTGALEVTQEYPSIRPILDLNFAATKTLDRRITFTRDSIGTYYGENGLVKYASNNVPRFDHDPTTGESLGLLIEESRTNKFTRSSTIGGTGWTQQGTAADYTPNTTEVAAPDGTFTALKWSPSVVPQYLYQNLSNIGTTQSTMSVWVRCANGQTQTFNMNLYSPTQSQSGFTATDQWQRFTWTFTPQSQANVYPIVPNQVATYYIWGPQLEEGAFATSYIPTTGTTVTRGSDQAKITGTNFTDFYNQTEGTVFSSHQQQSGLSETQNTYVYQIASNNSVSVAFRLIDHNNYYSTPARLSATQWANDVLMQKPDATNGERIKTAFACKVNDAAVSYDGATVLTDTSLDMNSGQTNMSIGMYPTSPQGFLNGHVQQISYYPKRLTNDQLQGLTA